MFDSQLLGFFLFSFLFFGVFFCFLTIRLVLGFFKYHVAQLNLGGLVAFKKIKNKKFGGLVFLLRELSGWSSVGVELFLGFVGCFWRIVLFSFFNCFLHSFPFKIV